jgi:hypothetical protein
LLGGVLLAIAVSAPAAEGAKVGPYRMTAQAGATRAVLFYVPWPKDLQMRPRLEIVRRGSRFVQFVPRSARDALGRDGRTIPAAREGRPLVVRDLDGDGEPEVAVMLFWGGTRCCFWSRVYRFERATRRYVPSTHFWGSNQDTPVLRDLNGDRSPEFVSGDRRFEGLSSTYSYVDPLQIWSYHRGDFVDVTHRFPRLIRSDARRLWTGYVRAGGGDGSGARSYLAAWAGDEYRLDQRRVADDAIERALRLKRLDVPQSEHAPGSRRWVADLKSFLERSGY